MYNGTESMLNRVSFWLESVEVPLIVWKWIQSAAGIGTEVNISSGGGT